MKSKKVVIIGGTGFIGSYLAKKISKRKNINLTILFRNTKPDNILPNINYLQIDGSAKSKKLGQIISGVDYLLILSQPNEKLIKNIIKYGKNIKKIIYTSTMLIYEDTDYSHEENSPIKPLTEYENSKCIEENLLIKFSEKKQVKLCIARLANVYGDPKNRGIIQKIFNSLINNSKFILNGDGEQKRDYIFVSDVVKLLDLITFAPQKQNINIFNLCTGKNYSINQVIKFIEETTNKKLSIQKNPPIIEKKYMTGNNSKIKNLLCFTKLTSLKSGLLTTYKRSLKQNV